MLTLKVDGGASANNFLMEFQSDILDTLVERPQVIETTALGAAYLAGLGIGYWDNLDDIKKSCKVPTNFIPNMSQDIREKYISDWRKAIERSKNWVED